MSRTRGKEPFYGYSGFWEVSVFVCVQSNADSNEKASRHARIAQLVEHQYKKCVTFPSPSCANSYVKRELIVVGSSPTPCNKLLMAISALRTQQKQENECAKCSGIVYRQTDSGKIIPVGQRCGAKITPPCYVPDGDGCAYQIYGDNNDEPIDRCKSCPLCQSDKIRHKQESVHNDPLALDELRQMRGEPVWCKELECYGIVKMEKVGSWANELFLVGTWHNGDAAVNFEYDIKSRGLTLYRHKPEEGTV